MKRRPATLGQPGGSDGGGADGSSCGTGATGYLSGIFTKYCLTRESISVTLIKERLTYPRSDCLNTGRPLKYVFCAFVPMRLFLGWIPSLNNNRSKPLLPPWKVLMPRNGRSVRYSGHALIEAIKSLSSCRGPFDFCSRRACWNKQPSDWRYIMGHLKECEARDCLSAGRNKSRNSFRPAGEADHSNLSGTELVGAGKRKSSFAEDFMLEHSNSSLFIAMIGRAGRYGAGVKEPQKSTQYYGFPS